MKLRRYRKKVANSAIFAKLITFFSSIAPLPTDFIVKSFFSEHFVDFITIV